MKTLNINKLVANKSGFSLQPSMNGVWIIIMWPGSCDISFVMRSCLESCVVARPPRSLRNDAFDIYSCSTSVPDALVVCSLFYWAWWVSLSLLLSSTANSVTTAIYPPDSSHELDWSNGRCDLVGATEDDTVRDFHFRGIQMTNISGVCLSESAVNRSSVTMLHWQMFSTCVTSLMFSHLAQSNVTQVENWRPSSNIIFFTISFYTTANISSGSIHRCFILHKTLWPFSWNPDQTSTKCLWWCRVMPEQSMYVLSCWY